MVSPVKLCCQSSELCPYTTPALCHTALVPAIQGYTYDFLLMLCMVHTHLCPVLRTAPQRGLGRKQDLVSPVSSPQRRLAVHSGLGSPRVLYRTVGGLWVKFCQEISEI